MTQVFVRARLLGGLGNQMFCYAAARSLSLRLNAHLELDCGALRADPLRDYALGTFGIKSLGRDLPRWLPWLLKFLGRLNHMGLPMPGPEVSAQPRLQTQPAILQCVWLVSHVRLLAVTILFPSVPRT